MDDRGFIFTTDAILALVIFFVFAASILTYYTLPSYMGAEHQHLETSAADALDVMAQDGTLYAATSQFAGDAASRAKAENEIRESLNSLLPEGTAYNLTIKGINGTTFSVQDDKGISVSTNRVTRVLVISAPKQGWLGRAWYKLEEVKFENETRNSTTTLWNFHNWLTNFSPWKDGNNRGRLATYYFWGSADNVPATSIPIEFSFPQDANIGGAYFLIGSNNKNSSSIANSPAYGANVTVNGNVYRINSTNFNFIYNRPGTGNPGYPMYNFRGILPSSQLNAGVNNFFVRFTSPVSNYVDTNRQGHDMPWFSMIGNYSNTIPVPQGIITRTFNANDAAGLATPSYSKAYDLETGVITNYNTPRSITWTNMFNQNHTLSDGIPFVITNIPDANEGSSVSTTHDVVVPPGSRIFDAYTVINAYGGVDSALVEVWNGTKWNTVFNSFNVGVDTFSVRSDGYGNTPGTIYIGDYLRSGTINKVRVTVWDHIGRNSNDYDLVGLVNCYSTVSYSALPIKWETFAFPSYQNSSSTTVNFTQPVRSFIVGDGAEKIFLFLGTGLDTRNVMVEVKNTTSTWKTLYNSKAVPFVLDIGKIDSTNGTPIFTTPAGGNYTGKPGTYDIRIRVDSSLSWQSGDGAGSPTTYANPEIYSGTRVGVIYPKFLANMWASEYSNDPVTAQNLAKQALIEDLINSGFSNSSLDPSLIKTEALYTGDLPNAISVRLDLWRN
ncbi:MAG: hypothetical protein Q7U35_07930 [Methanobacteriaceae archaeon]|nr:hypothetical protein [Methanobacteriaceae archaeon]MDP2836019.1 hypothetical protein [Methanobacteriaceae archaeon]